MLVLGGGPGGYTAAIRGAQKGFKTVLVERGPLGGTCLNRGCVPTKTLLEDARLLTVVRQCNFLKGDLKVNRKRILERKNMVVEGSRGWVANILAGNGVKLVRGEATFCAPKTVTVRGENNENVEIKAEKVIIAVGASTDYGPGLGPDHENIWSTDDALTLKTIPRRLAIVGAGNRGVEFAQIYQNLGSQVLIIEKQKRILPRIHWELSDRYKRILLERKIRVMTDSLLADVEQSGSDGVTLTVENKEGRQHIKADKVILTGNRFPSFERLNIESAGLNLQNGILACNPSMETNEDGIYVIGDASGPPFMAHKAIGQAIIAVDHIAGAEPGREPILVPNIIYGDPEIATIGLSEDEAEDIGRAIKVGEFHFVGNGRSGTMGNDQGIVKIVSDAKTGIVLGVHILGPQATELISLATMAMKNGVTVDGIKKTIFPHPTLSETFFEAALATDGEAIHLLVDGEDFSG